MGKLFDFETSQHSAKHCSIVSIVAVFGDFSKYYALQKAVNQNARAQLISGLLKFGNVIPLEHFSMVTGPNEPLQHSI